MSLWGTFSILTITCVTCTSHGWTIGLLACFRFVCFSAWHLSNVDEPCSLKSHLNTDKKIVLQQCCLSSPEHRLWVLYITICLQIKLIKPNCFPFLGYLIFQETLIIVAQDQNLGLILDSSLFVAPIPSINKSCCSLFKINAVSDHVSYQAFWFEPHLSNHLRINVLAMTLVEFTSVSFAFRNKCYGLTDRNVFPHSLGVWSLKAGYEHDHVPTAMQ